MKILIVDDSRAMRMIVKKTLRQAGYGDAEVSEAEDGRAAAAQVQRDLPDLILTDWNMPGIGGAQLLGWLQKSKYPGVVGVISSSATVHMQAEAGALGANFVVSKPFTAEGLGGELSDAGFKRKGAANSANHGPVVSLKFDATGVQAALGGAFRRKIEVEARPVTPWVGPAVSIQYGDANGQQAVVLCEPTLAAALGAALTLIPAGVVREAGRGDVPEHLHSNIREVFNLLVQLVGRRDRAARLGRIDFEGTSPTDPADERLDLNVSIAGYGEGRLSLYRERYRAAA